MLFANWRLINELLSLADVALELVDARDPLATRCKKLEGMVKSKGLPLILVLNKSDLIPRSVAEAWKEYFERVEGIKTVYIAARERKGTRVLRRTIKEVVGGKKPITVAIFGVPKVGKSTLINILKGRHSARTSPYPGTPGYTTRAQLYRIGGGIYLIDTPGIVPPDTDEVEYLIRSRAIDEIENPVEVAVKIIKKVSKYNPHAFKQAYGIDSTDPDVILKELAIRRGWVYRSDGEPIIHESAKLIIRDYLDGKIPFYTTPPQPLKSHHQKA